MEQCFKCRKLLSFESFELFNSGNRDNICLVCRERDKKNLIIITDVKKSRYSKKLKKAERQRYREKNLDKIRKKAQTNEAHYSQLRFKAKIHNQEFTLTLDQYKILVIPNSCYYWPTHTLPLYGAGLDRIDNTKGYISENVIPCCTNCNRLRGDRLTVQETKLAVKVVEEFRLQM